MMDLNIDWVVVHLPYVIKAYSCTRGYLDPLFTPSDAVFIRGFNLDGKPAFETIKQLYAQ